MSELKVVHEWFGGTGPITNLYRVDEAGAITCQNPTALTEYMPPSLFSVGRELAALAKRVEELEVTKELCFQTMTGKNAHIDGLEAKITRLREDNTRLRKRMGRTPLDRLREFLEAPDDPSDCEEMAETITRLREALKKYGHCLDECNSIMGWTLDAECDCGLAALRADIPTQSGDSGTKRQQLETSADKSEQGE